MTMVLFSPVWVTRQFSKNDYENLPMGFADKLVQLKTKLLQIKNTF